MHSYACSHPQSWHLCNLPMGHPPVTAGGRESGRNTTRQSNGSLADCTWPWKKTQQVCMKKKNI